MSGMHNITRPNGHLTSSLGRCVGRSAASDVELRALRRRAWQETGVIVLRPEEIDDGFARQALINAAHALFGPRAPAPDRTAAQPQGGVMTEGISSHTQQALASGAPTPELIKARFEEAAEALRALPLSARDRPRARLSHWPDVVHQAMLAYGWSEARVRPPAPSPAAIDRLDETLSWLWPLADDERRLVMARAFRLPWRRIEDLDGRSERTLRNVHARVLSAVAARLRGASAP